MGQFQLAFEGFSKRTMAKADRVVKEVLVRLHDRVTELSPVGNPELWASAQGSSGISRTLSRGARVTIKAPKGYVGGRFRANWQLTRDAAAEDELYTPIVGPFPDKNPIDVSQEAAGHKWYLVNNLPYAHRIENGWSYLQAPAGVVGIAVIEFKQIVKAAIAEIKLTGISRVEIGA